jgi:ADP-ribose pyrophosphatase
MERQLGERLVSSRTVFTGRLISVRVDEVELPGGPRASREVVVHPGAVAIIPLLPQDRVVMIRQYRHPAAKVLYELPAGTLQPGESPADCARRELLEETGYQAGELAPLFSMYLSPGYCTELIHLFLATGLEPAASTGTDSDERVEPFILTLSEALAMIGRGDVQNAAAVAGLLAVGAQERRLARALAQGRPACTREGAGKPLRRSLGAGGKEPSP